MSDEGDIDRNGDSEERDDDDLDDDWEREELDEMDFAIADSLLLSDDVKLDPKRGCVLDDGDEAVLFSPTRNTADAFEALEMLMMDTNYTFRVWQEWVSSETRRTVFEILRFNGKVLFLWDYGILATGESYEDDPERAFREAMASALHDYVGKKAR
jgi:hypothetical protein